MSSGTAPGERQLIEDTVARARRGDVAAREELTRRYRPRVFEFVRANEARGRSEQDAHDITQEVFVRALRSLGTYAGDSSFERWLFVIARRSSSDFYRSRRTMPAVAEPEQAVESNAEANLDSMTPLEHLVRSETIGEVRGAFSRLSADHKAVLNHRIVYRLSVAQTAELMARSEAAVKMLQLRAIEALTVNFSQRDGSNGSAEGGA